MDTSLIVSPYARVVVERVFEVLSSGGGAFESGMFVVPFAGGHGTLRRMSDGSGALFGAVGSHPIALVGRDDAPEHVRSVLDRLLEVAEGRLVPAAA